MLLLNASALVVVSLARGALRSQQSAQLTTTSWALALQSVETAAASRCAVGVGVGNASLPRVIAGWTDHAQIGWRDRDVRVAMTFSPMAGVSPLPLALRAGWSCP